MRKVHIDINPQHHLGTDRYPYHASLTNADRARALKARVLEDLGSRRALRPEELETQLLKMEQRLNAIRVDSKHHLGLCHTYSKDMKFLKSLSMKAKKDFKNVFTRQALQKWLRSKRYEAPNIASIKDICQLLTTHA